MGEWYYGIDDQRFGPVDTATLKQLARSGRIGQEDLVWKEGLKDWVPARKVQGLFKASGPPPMPDAGVAPLRTKPASPSPSTAAAMPEFEALCWYRKANNWYSVIGISLLSTQVLPVPPILLVLTTLPLLFLTVYQKSRSGNVELVQVWVKALVALVILGLTVVILFMSSSIG